MKLSKKIFPVLRPVYKEELSLHSTLIICPWCYSVTDYKYEQGEDICLICRRIITDNDIDEYLEREDSYV